MSTNVGCCWMVLARANRVDEILAGLPLANAALVSAIAESFCRAIATSQTLILAWSALLMTAGVSVATVSCTPLIACATEFSIAAAPAMVCCEAVMPAVGGLTDADFTVQPVKHAASMAAMTMRVLMVCSFLPARPAVLLRAGMTRLPPARRRVAGILSGWGMGRWD